jgi:hypothetical protein
MRYLHEMTALGLIMSAILSVGPHDSIREPLDGFG